MKPVALVRSLVPSVWLWLGFHGCGTSLLYRVPRSQSGARRSSSVRHLLVCVHEDTAQCLPVRRRCCQIPLSRSCGLISRGRQGTTGIEPVTSTVSILIVCSNTVLGNVVAGTPAAAWWMNTAAYQPVVGFSLPFRCRDHGPARRLGAWLP
jgi:hypothetical protein